MAQHSVKFGIVIPTSWERRSLVELLEDTSFEVTYSKSLWSPWVEYHVHFYGLIAIIIDSYIGRDNAAAATEFLINRYHPEIILHAGAAGAVDPDLMPGDIVIGSAVRSVASQTVMRSRASLALPPGLDRFYKDGEPQHHDRLLADPVLVRKAAQIAVELAPQWGAWTAPGWPSSFDQRDAAVVIGQVGTAEAWVRNIEYYDFYYKHFSDFSNPEDTTAKLLCVDMESAAVAARACAYDIPSLVVRGISDNDRYEPQLNGMKEIGPAT